MHLLISFLSSHHILTLAYPVWQQMGWHLDAFQCFCSSVEAHESEFLSVLQYMNLDLQNVDRGGLYFDPSDYRRTDKEVSRGGNSNTLPVRQI